MEGVIWDGVSVYEGLEIVALCAFEPVGYSFEEVVVMYSWITVVLNS